MSTQVDSLLYFFENLISLCLFVCLFLFYFFFCHCFRAWCQWVHCLIICVLPISTPFFCSVLLLCGPLFPLILSRCPHVSHPRQLKSTVVLWSVVPADNQTKIGYSKAQVLSAAAPVSKLMNSDQSQKGICCSIYWSHSFPLLFFFFF